MKDHIDEYVEQIHLTAIEASTKKLIQSIIGLELNRELHAFEDRIRTYNHVRLLHGLDFTKNHIRL